MRKGASHTSLSAVCGAWKNNTNGMGGRAWKRFFAACSMSRPRAVNRDGRARDEAARFARQENDQPANYIEIAPATQRNTGDELLVNLRIAEQGLIHLCPEWSRY